MISRRKFLQTGVGGSAYVTLAATTAGAANAPGITDDEIKFGQTMPYSGPASAYGLVGRTEAAYFRMINETGGVNGRKLTLISLDDGYNPARTVEQVRGLVEQEQVAFLFQTLGTTQNAAIRDYLNNNKIPALFVASGASMFADPMHYPWMIPFNASFRTEARIYAKHILATKPAARIGVLYENDDAGQDYVMGMREGLGPDHAGMIVKELSYEPSEPTLDSQIITLQGLAVDTLFIAATAKFGALTIRKVFDMEWRPVRYLSVNSVSISGTLKPAGLDKSIGLISAVWGKDPGDPRWKDDVGFKEYAAFATKYLPPGSVTDFIPTYGFGAAQLLTQVLRQCADDLSRENILRQATHIRDFDFGRTMLLPGIKFDVSPTDYRPVHQMQLVRFTGESWEPFGEILTD
jgi:ABC-type branched-subunit amino acid transport system substrate-binding protein